MQKIRVGKFNNTWCPKENNFVRVAKCFECKFCRHMVLNEKLNEGESEGQFVCKFTELYKN